MLLKTLKNSFEKTESTYENIDSYTICIYFI